MIYLTGGNAYSVVHDHKNGWNPEGFRERFSEVLERYDYVVGDWGYNQLRLRGFFREPQPKVPRESVISHLFDYINEYCNFGCAYFVLEKLDPASVPEGAGIKLEDLPVAAPVVEAGEEGAEADDAAEQPAPAPVAAIVIPPGGMLLRWPLKERPGGRVPGTSPSAVARAVSESAERRAAAAQTAAASAAAREEMYGRGGHYESSGRQGRSSSADGGRDRRPGGSSGGSRSGGGHERRPSGGYNKSNQGNGYSKPNSDSRPPRDAGERVQLHSSSSEGGYRSNSPDSQSSGSASRSGGSKWPSKNRRRNPNGNPHSNANPNPNAQQAPKSNPNSNRPPRQEGGPRSEGAPRPDKGPSPGGSERT